MEATGKLKLIQTKYKYSLKTWNRFAPQPGKHSYDLIRIMLCDSIRKRGSAMVGLLCNLPREVFLPKHVAGYGRVPWRGHLGWRVYWFWLHCPHVVVADVVVHHGGEGWREGQASRGKERMIKTSATGRKTVLSVEVDTYLERLEKKSEFTSCWPWSAENSKAFLVSGLE